MANATINQTAKTSIEVVRSYIISHDHVTEKAVIKLPIADLNLHVRGEVASYFHEWMVSFENGSYKIAIDSSLGMKCVKIAASMTTKNGKNAKLQKSVDNMVEGLGELIGRNITTTVLAIPMRTEVKLTKSKGTVNVEDVIPSVYWEE